MRNFAQVASLLYRLTERNKTWTWNKECEVAFCTLKEMLTSTGINLENLSRGGGGGGQKWKVTVFEGVMYKEGGMGACLPRKILKFRRSEITSGAFSSKFALPMNGPHHWCR